MDLDHKNINDSSSDSSSENLLQLRYIDLFWVLKGHLHEGYQSTSKLIEDHLTRILEEPYTIPKIFSHTIVKLIHEINKKWKAKNSTLNTFLKFNKSWLQNTCEFPKARLKNVNDMRSPVKKKQRTKNKICTEKNFFNLSERSKYRKTVDLRSSSSCPEAMCFAASAKFKGKGNIDAARVLADISHGPASKGSEYRKTYDVESKFEAVSPLRALKWVLNNDISKRAYEEIHELCPNLPSYKALLKAKIECYPPGIRVNEHEAEVPLQDALNHTATRICEGLREIIFERISPANQQRIILQCKYGFDGSSGHSQYKQSCTSKDGIEFQDSSMMSTCFVPLRLIYVDAITKKEVVLWINPIPSSPFHCRPLRLQFLKENPKVIVNEKAWIDDQIENLTDLKIIIDLVNVIIAYQMFPTMFDVKTINALTKTKSTQECYICNLTIKNFKNIDNCLSVQIKEDNLQYGISSLHARIRFFECIYNLGCKLPFKRWSLGPKNALYNAFFEHKNGIKNNFKDRLNLKVDQPKQGSGNTTDGNTARIAFQNPQIFSEITGVDVDIVERFACILEVITCSFAVNPILFGDYCTGTARKFSKYYGWFNMSPTVHKVLIHGKNIIAKTTVPIGILSEEALEAGNKLIRRFRERSSRKMSRKMTMEDVFQRLLANSDPLVASLRKKSDRKVLTFSSEARKMLLEPEIFTEVNDNSLDENDSEDDGEKELTMNKENESYNYNGSDIDEEQ